MSIFVGLDCGGSSCRAVAVDGEGKTLFQGQARSANLASTPERVLASNLRRATDGCPPAQAVCGCFAGLLTRDDRLRAEDHLRHIFPTALIRAEPDYAAALCAAEPEPDVCVISGTGSLICSRSNGKIVKSGGGGFILGDAGSAFQFGRDALRHFLFGESPPSVRLTAAVEEFFSTTEPNAIIASVYRGPCPAATVAKLAKTLGHEAAEGCEYALESLDVNMSELAGLTARHVRKNRGVNLDLLMVGLAGGIWKAGALFKIAFKEKLAAALPWTEIVLVPSRQPPVRGALKLAKEISVGH